jgi:serine O-acetyltransferase
LSSLRLTDAFVDQLVEARRQHAFPVHLRSSARAFAQRALALLFPHFSQGAGGEARPELVQAEAILLAQSLVELLRTLEVCAPGIDQAIPQKFLDGLPGAYALLRSDAEAMFQGDPAARSLDEVILTYPGFFAIAVYRIAHVLQGLGVPLLPRVLTEYAHAQSGVDIHAAATIGRSFFIDHGTGVVIGETTVIGNGVKLYQGVTLGALLVDKALSRKRRHPTLEDNVVVYSNATILGGDTVIGHDSVIGGNAWLTESVPPFSMVSHQSEVRQRRRSPKDDLDFHI